MEILDVGVIMSSQTNWVFMDMVDRYPGARIFYDNTAKNCNCGRPDCGREGMQITLQGLFEGNKEKCALLFQRLHELDRIPTDDEIKAILEDITGVRIGRRGNPEDDSARELSDVTRMLEDMFPGMKVTEIKPLD